MYFAGLQPVVITEDTCTPLTTYRALYPFTARNSDELTLEADCLIQVLMSTHIPLCSCKCTYSSTHIIWLPVDPQVDESTVRETGWLYGSYRGNSGWFPESYAERCSKDSQTELTAPITHSTAPSTNYPGFGTKTTLLLTRLCNLA